jgi:large subunit ribosomal protein L6
MSRVGKLPISIPKDVEIKMDGENIIIKGKYGELLKDIPSPIKIDFNDQFITLTRQDDSRISRQLHGLTRALVNNMVLGVSERFCKTLILKGVGYRAQADSKNLTLNVGYSHQVVMPIPSGIEVKVEANVNLSITGISKEKVGLFASQIRAVRPPEPYKGKGVMYTDEVILRKVGKSGK